MDEEFLKKFVGKRICVYTVGDSDGWRNVLVGGISGGILSGMIGETLNIFIECDMIVAVSEE